MNKLVVIFFCFILCLVPSRMVHANQNIQESYRKIKTKIIEKKEFPPIEINTEVKNEKIFLPPPLVPAISNEILKTGTFYIEKETYGNRVKIKITFVIDEKEFTNLEKVLELNIIE